MALMTRGRATATQCRFSPGTPSPWSLVAWIPDALPTVYAHEREETPWGDRWGESTWSATVRLVVDILGAPVDHTGGGQPGLRSAEL